MSAAVRDVECTEILGKYVPRAVALGIVDWVKQSTGWAGESLGGRASQNIATETAAALRYFLKDERLQERCMEELETALGLRTVEPRPVPGARKDDLGPSGTVPLNLEDDVARVRGKVLEACHKAGFSAIERTKLATAISELARNVITYAGHGSVEIDMLHGQAGKQRRGLEVRVIDDGPGIANLDEILAGRYVSKTGMGKGLRGARQLVDEFAVDTARGRGTRIRVRHYIK